MVSWKNRAQHGTMKSWTDVKAHKKAQAVSTRPESLTILKALQEFQLTAVEPASKAWGQTAFLLA